MSKYFNQSRRRVNDPAMAGRAIEQSEFRREIEEITKTDVPAGNTLDPRISGCRKIRLTETAEPRLIHSRADFSGVVLESYRALRTRLLRARSKQELRSLVLSSAVAGEGKTLTSMNLGLCCSRLHDFRVLVVDSDLRTRGLTHLIGNPGGPGLSEILAGETDYQDAILATEYPNLFVLTAGSETSNASELYSGNQWKELISWCSRAFDFVLIDAPPVLPVADCEQIVNACDGVLIIVRALQTQREALKKTAAQIDSRKLLGVIFNGGHVEASDKYAAAYTTSHNDGHIQEVVVQVPTEVEVAK